MNSKKPAPKFRRTPIKRTKANIQKVKNLVAKENPASYRYIKKETGLSLRTIHNVVHQNLQLNTRKKGKVHKLTATQK